MPKTAEVADAAIDAAYAKLTDKARQSRQVWGQARVPMDACAAELNAIVARGGYIWDVWVFGDSTCVVLWYRWE